MPPASVHAAVRSIDADADGYIGADDWLAWMAPVAALDAAAAQVRAAAGGSGGASPVGSPRGGGRLSASAIEQFIIPELHEVGVRSTEGAGAAEPRGGARRGWFGF